MATPVLYTQAAELLFLADVVAGDLTGALIHLYQNNLVFDPTTVVIGDLVDANYNTYAALVLAWGVPSVSDDGHVETIAAAQVWRPTDALAPNDIYGYYITTAGGVLLMGGFFEGGPFPMNSTLDVITTTVVFRLGQDGYVSVVT